MSPARRPRHRRRIAAAVLLAAVLGAVASGCRGREPLEQRLERDLLLRRKAALERELARSATAPEAGVVIGVPAALIDELLSAALPVEAELARRFRVTVDTARVDFESGLALVRLAARVAALEREDVAARVEIVGALEVLEIRDAGTLTTRVEILGWQTHEVRLGTLTAPAGRLLDEFAARPASDLNALLDRMEIPVRLAPTVSLPQVAEDAVTIPAVDIPVAARIEDVRVGGGRLWVFVDVTVPGGSR